jgi:hypothetical protein
LTNISAPLSSVDGSGALFESDFEVAAEAAVAADNSALLISMMDPLR